MSKDKKWLSRSTDYRITATLGRSEFVGWKVRPKLVAANEEVPLLNGYIYDLQGYMLSGKHQGEVVELPPCKLEMAPTRHCRCSAYKFPHAPGFGACQDQKFEQVAPPGLTLEELFK